ncbi:alpha/beta hydrolase family protein [Nonomuraea phyllanthi]|uniref:alpha/beta hydrolase family protein n=1 Tax=Nonomuraea phyllanthi TaxID=2219224 RepID=UPI001D0157AF|nr:alpha/beta fold hydrolase [Nonomuraea phyllanthi]
MTRRGATACLAVALAVASATALGSGTAAASVGPSSGGTPCLPDSPAHPSCVSGTLADGTPYEFVVPARWNGTVVVALDFAGTGRNEPLTARLLADGVARGGTSRAITGWDIRSAIDNQAEALARFEQAYGRARKAIASGTSMGGFVAAGVAQVHPHAFDAAVPMCGGLGGSVAQWNQKLDTVFVLERLVAPGLPVIDIPEDVESARKAWIDALAAAQQTPEGRARIALAAAIGQLPAWGRNPDGSTPPPPDSRDADALEQGAYLALSGGPLPYIGQAMSSRRQIMAVVGGNPSWNTGVDYAKQLRLADPALRRAVGDLYRAAGLELADDLRNLSAAPRIAADPGAVERFARGIVLDGELRIPVLTLSGTGDQISTVAQQQSYGEKVRRAGANSLLRQTYTETVGHCDFSPAEQQAALATMLERLRTGHWPATSAPAMNARAAALAADPAPRYVPFTPPRFNRPYPG